MRSIALITMIMAGCEGSDEHAGDSTNGAEVYTNSCASCHGANGEGESESGVEGASALHEHVPESDDHHLEETILEGSGQMPAIDLPEAEVFDVIAYLRHEFGEHTGEDEHEDE